MTELNLMDVFKDLILLEAGMSLRLMGVKRTWREKFSTSVRFGSFAGSILGVGVRWLPLRGPTPCGCDALVFFNRSINA